jgi:prephenate dehydrogenase
MPSPKYKKIAVLGAGLIGGSVIRAATKKGVAETISVYDRTEQTRIAIATLPGIFISNDAASAVRDAELVVLCVPLEAMAAVLREALPGISPSALVTDVGSVKQPVEETLGPLLHGKARWIGGHPMAGREKSGFAAGDAALFEGAAVILTPTAETDFETLRFATEFWEALGGRVSTLSPHEHDAQMARLSHAVHIGASALIRMAGKSDLKLAGPGLRDTTRVASGAASLWQGILAANRTEIISTVDALTADLAQVRGFLKEGNDAELHAWLSEANELRKKLEATAP